MMDDIYLGESPCDEDCAQVGKPDYGIRAIAECRALINQIRRMNGREPEGANLVIISSNHDYGTVYAVHCKFDESKQAAIDYAFKIESNYPEKWDLLAKKELDILPDHVSVTEEHLLFKD